MKEVGSQNSVVNLTSLGHFLRAFRGCSLNQFEISHVSHVKFKRACKAGKTVARMHLWPCIHLSRCASHAARLSLAGAEPSVSALSLHEFPSQVHHDVHGLAHSAEESE